MTVQRQIRRHPPTTLRVTFLDPTSGQRSEAVAWDASLGGLFLETTTPFVEGALVALEITTADAKVGVDARVLWARPTRAGEDEPPGMSVRFIDLPDEVSVALNRALQSGMQERTILGVGAAAAPPPTQERTILGVGGAAHEPTQLGLQAAPPPAAGAPPPAAGAPPPAAGAPPVERSGSRATQLGVAPPANAPAKPKLVIAETSLPGTPARIPAPEPAEVKRAPSPAAQAEPAGKASRPPPKEELRADSRSMAPSAPPNPPMQGSALGRIFVLLLLGGAAAAVYVYREPLAQMIAGPQPTTTATPPPAPAPTPSPTASEAARASGSVGVAPSASVVAPSASVAAPSESSHVLDAGAHDAGHGRDAGRDGGTKHDGGAHKHEAPHTKPAPHGD